MIKSSHTTEAVARLSLLLDALTSDWQPIDQLVDRVGIYPEHHGAAIRMLARDCRALMALGFQVERSIGHHDPSWRIVGHTRFGAEVRTRFCTRCGQWRAETLFGKNAGEKSGIARYCRYCARRTPNVALSGPGHQEWRAKLPERAHIRRVGRPATPRYWRAVTIDDVTYPSLSAAARALGVSRQAVWNRMKRRHV